MAFTQDQPTRRARHSRSLQTYHRTRSATAFFESALVQRTYAGRKAWVRECSPSPEDNGRVSGGSSRASRQSHLDPNEYDDTYEQDTSNATHLPQPASGPHGYSGRRDRGPRPLRAGYNQRMETHAILLNITNETSEQARL